MMLKRFLPLAVVFNARTDHEFGGDCLERINRDQLQRYFGNTAGLL